MIGKNKVKVSTPRSEKVLVSSKTPKHCNKSSVHDKRCQTTPSKKHQHFPQNNRMDSWDHYNDRPHPAHRLGNDPFSIDYATDHHKPAKTYSNNQRLDSNHGHLMQSSLGSDYQNIGYSTGALEAASFGYSMPFLQKDGPFSRAVSTSFGELTKTARDSHMTSEILRMDRHKEVDNYADHRSRTSDCDSESSWKALHQVASVDEETYYRQYSRNQGRPSPPLQNDNNFRGESPFDSIQLSSSTLSNSSSSNLIRSFPSPSKLIRLNSLSSVASAQMPLETCVTYDSKTQAAFGEHVYSAKETRLGKRASPAQSESPFKKSRGNSPSSFTNFHEPPCFTLSLDSLNSFPNDEQNQQNYLTQNHQTISKPYLSDVKTSWDLTDKIVGTFTFDTCESYGDSSGHFPRRESDHFINRTISAKVEGSSDSSENGPMYTYFDSSQEKRNPSFDNYIDPRISISDEKRDESLSSKSDTREDNIHDHSLVPHAWNHPYTSNYGPSFYHQPLSRGPNITNTMDCNTYHGQHSIEKGYPPFLSQDCTKAPASNIDFRSYWPQYGYMYPHYASTEYWRLSRNAFYSENGSQVMTGQTNIHQPKILNINKWSAEDDALLTSIMKMNKYDEGDFESVAAELGHGKLAKDCEARWFRYLKPGARKGNWQDFEDAIVIESVLSSKEQPFTKWSELAQRLPGRVGKQIRDRWINHLNPNINHNPFSPEEDLLLWDGHKKYGNKWVEISVKCFQSSRSENHIKNRFYSASFKKFVISEFGEDSYKEKICSDDGKVPLSSTDETDVSEPNKS